MHHSGVIKKMHSNLGDSVDYHLPLGDNLINLNPFINQKIKLSFKNSIFCIKCNNQIIKCILTPF